MKRAVMTVPDRLPFAGHRGRPLQGMAGRKRAGDEADVPTSD